MGVLGNRGKCAQVCRLPYDLIEKDKNDKVIDSGYLLSPRDLCSLELLPSILSLGIDSLKIEGRMKTPDYVATVTKIYRKYIDLAYSNKPFEVSENDKGTLLQVFNRGGFSTGHLKAEENKELIFPDSPTNIGIYIGNISNYNKDKGYITLNLNESIAIGDTISIEGETGRYNVSELLINNENCPKGNAKDTVKLGRMKGNIKIGSKVYKMSSKELCSEAKNTYLENSNLKKIGIIFTITIKKDQPVKVKIEANKPPFYLKKIIEYTSEITADTAINTPITKDDVITQFSKLGNTPYNINNISVNLDENLYLNIKDLNTIRRNSILLLEESIINKRDYKEFVPIKSKKKDSIALSSRKVSILLEVLHLDYDYSALEGIDNVYIPLKLLANKKYTDILDILSNKFNMYVYMPTIIKANYKNLMLNNLDEIVERFNIKGFVISNIAGLFFLEKYINKGYKIVANYTMNVFNSYTTSALKDIGVTCITPSVELNKDNLINLINNSLLPTELIAYGRMILMNSAYCLLGKTNKCYPECEMRCSNNKKYYLKDRKNFKFRILPDNVQTVTSIYNSQITSIDTLEFNIESVRISILDETIEEINKIISTVKSGKKLEGNGYTNGNLKREI